MISWLFLGVVVGLLVGVPLLSALLPDARDRLSSRERAVVSDVLDAAPICRNALGRVTEVEVDDAASPEEIRYRCAWTVLGIAGRSHTAQCVGGRWRYGGWQETLSTGSC